MAAIPHCDEVIDTREETTFSDTKEDAAGQKALEVVYQAHTSHDETPAEHDEGQPDTWAEALHHHVAWDFGSDIKWEEDGERDVVV